jgi:hypothetical protein
MTQANENGSRLDRIEAIMLELATASIRHDNAINRHDEEFGRVINRHDEEFSRIHAALESLTAGQEFNRQSIATLTASIQDLRNMVADYIQARSENQ